MMLSCQQPREKQIRAALEAWLFDRHAADPTTAIIHELDVPRPSGRVDLALINGRLAGFEIKSAADTLQRLRTQQVSFSSVFERMTLVVADRHSVAGLAAVPSWWAVIETSGRGFKVRQRGRLNPDLNLTNLLYVLTRAELLEVERALLFSATLRMRPKSEIVESIIAANRRQATLRLIREALKRRTTEIS